MSTPPWTTEQKDAAIHRGPHPSALLHAPFLTEELVGMIDRKQWFVLPYDTVKHLPNLRLSPMGVIPQRDRRPRPDCRLHFSGVNQDTFKLAPPEAMQFGRTLPRIITQIVNAPSSSWPRVPQQV